MAAISVRQLHRTIGAQHVLAGIVLDVEARRTLALVGENGAGKSTLIRVLVDLQTISLGSVVIDGRPSTEATARDALAYLPERFQPAYFLNGIHFINYMLALYGTAPSEVERDRVCGQLGLGPDTLAKSVQTYSKGMSQMLGLAVCLLSGRPILILDEPMSGLDPTARVRLQRALREHRDGGGTILFTTHLLADAEALADRVAVLHDGRIVADGSPDELKAQYQVDDLESVFVECVGGVDRVAT